MFDTAPLRLQREEQLDRLASDTFDILIVGGGVTGAYTALDASLRGYRVALVEKNDFASGTSSKSSKMVHGGLRYIEQGNLGLVRHSLLERQRLRRNARHLVQRLPFMFPVLDKTAFSTNAWPPPLRACCGLTIWPAAGEKAFCTRNSRRRRCSPTARRLMKNSFPADLCTLTPESMTPG